MIFRSYCCNHKTTFTAGSLEFYINPLAKKSILAMSPWGGLPAPAAGIQGRSRPDLAGGRCLELLWTEPGRDVVLAGRQQGRWQPAVVPVWCARRGLLPGGGGGHARRRATLGASEGAREGSWVEGRRWLGAEGGVPRRRRL
jgi:hypothetical protein